MPPKQRPRRINDEDLTLWARVTQSTNPLTPQERKSQDRVQPIGEQSKPKAVARTSKPEVTQSTPKKAGPSPAKPSRSQLNMDARAFGRMQRGKLTPEARIDLHGMTVATAYSALTSFILRSRSAGRRLVLVITGKGKDATAIEALSESRGVLRRQVPHWLETPPLSNAVLQIESAHQRHGGSGAFYIYLRR